MFNINSCWLLDSNRVPLELEAAALPTEPQPMPNCQDLFIALAIIFLMFGSIFAKTFCYLRNSLSFTNLILLEQILALAS